MIGRSNVFHFLADEVPEWASVWHVWNVWLPRRTITGRLVWGTVLRRRDGRRWIYKKADQC